MFLGAGKIELVNTTACIIIEKGPGGTGTTRDH